MRVENLYMDFWKEGHKIDTDIIKNLDKKFIE